MLILSTQEVRAHVRDDPMESLEHALHDDSHDQPHTQSRKGNGKGGKGKESKRSPASEEDDVARDAPDDDVKLTWQYKHIWNGTPISSAQFRVRQGHENPSSWLLSNVRSSVIVWLFIVVWMAVREELVACVPG